MNEVYEFFAKLSDTSDWPPRWLCGNWSDFHGWLYISSDLMIWLAYMCIPLILIRFVIVKQGIPLRGIFWLFGAFILLCGLTHLMDVIIFWVPAYRISALIRFVTGVVSIATVVGLIKYFDDALGLRTSEEYEYELKYRQKALQALERSNEELKQFAYVASHDLQSPLKTIEGYLGLLESKYAGQLDETGIKLVETTANSAQRMRVLINDLLDFSQAGLDLNFEEIPINELVEEALEELQQEIKESSASIITGDLPTLRVSRTDIKRVFLNLISNAIKYRRPGETPEIRISAVDLGAEWEIHVKDNGIGIEETYYHKIFLVFQRLHGRKEYPGTGIGLAACKKIVETHNGKIWLESLAGRGSDFYFTIPKDLKTIYDFKRQE